MNVIWKRLTPDADPLPGWLACPDGEGQGPAVLMLHHAPGLTGDYKTNAALLAQLGFTVLVPNLFNMLGFPGDHHIGQGPAIQAKHGDADFLKVVRDAFDYLARLPTVDETRIGAVGHCLGGRLGIPFAADTPQLAALVLYYATIRDENVTQLRPRHSYETAKLVKCATQVFYGGADHLTSKEIQLKLWMSFIESGAALEWHYFGEGKHGFANPDSEWYQPAYAMTAWPLTVAFLKRALM